ncbi:hypothetical protein [Bacillus kexueae]|uniref:UPF0738 family protein n=1 Tax=Aeribacillus kexueae TaxID=2078952 RepID=UPI001FAF0745|nr:hypothetical protein [Bacillus kexueae]
MKKRIEVIEATQVENQLILKTESFGDGADQLQASGQLLADSDQLAFIYILDSGSDFIYLSISSTHWPQLKMAMEANDAIIAEVEGHQISLDNIHEELQYLVENIKDNANYGEEMEQKVVEVFHP